MLMKLLLDLIVCCWHIFRSHNLHLLKYNFVSVINVGMSMSAAAVHSVPLSSLSLALLLVVAAAASHSFPARYAFVFETNMGHNKTTSLQ